MSNVGRLAALEYEAEASWGVDTGTFATHRLPLIGTIDASGLTHEKLEPGAVYQRRQEGSPYILGKIGGQFSMKMDLTGHGTTTAGSPTIDAVETFLGLVFGNAALSATASDTATGGTASIPTMTSATGFNAGSACFFGALGDADGDAQFHGITTHAGSNLTLLNALRAAPANGAVVYPAALMYPSASPTTGAITGTRFRILTGNLQYQLHGCWPMSVAFSGLNPGERPQIDITWGVSWWEYDNGTFPSTVTSNLYNPAIIAAGSLHVQDVGTVTRNERTSCRNFGVTYGLGVTPLMGNGGVNGYQTVVGAVRTGDTIDVTWTEDADTVTTSPVLPGYGTASTRKVVCWTGSTAAGARIGMLMRSVCITNVATQKIDGDINRLTITGRAYNGATTTNDLTLSAFVLGYG